MADKMDWNLDILEPVEPEWNVDILQPHEGPDEPEIFEPTDGRPELSFGRVMKKFAYSARALPANIAAAARSEAQTFDPKVIEATPVSEASVRAGAVGIPDMSGRSIPSHEPEAQEAMRQNQNKEFFSRLPDDEQAQVLTEMENLVSKGRESLLAFEESLQSVYKNRIIDQSVKSETLFSIPEEFQKSSGIIEDVAGGIGTSLASLPTYAINPLLGAATTYLNIKGAKVQELEDLGAEPMEVEKAATFSALVQTPLESLVNVQMLSTILKPQKTWVSSLVKIFETQLSEGATEFVQQYPDEYATMMALNPQASGAELASEFIDRIPEITGEAAYAGLVGFLSAGATTGAGVAARNAINALTTNAQRAEQDVEIAKLQETVQRVQDGKATDEDFDFLSGIMEQAISPETEVEQIIEAAGDYADIAAPIESPARTAVLKGVSKTLNPEQTTAVTAVYDQMARAHAEANGVETSAFYDLFSFEKKEEPEDGVLYQPPVEEEGPAIKKGPRAAVKGAFDAAAKKTITAFQGADISSALHEIAHVKLSLMTVENSDNYYALADWAGVPRKTADKFDLNVWSTAQLEKVAQGFEVYMAEGRSPNTRLQAVFAQIKDWMLQIYGSIRNINVELSDEARAVYDSWLAASQEKASEASTEIDEWLRTDGLEAFDFKPESASYDDIAWEARKRVLSGIVQKRTERDADIRKRLTKQAKQDVDSRPEYQLLTDIRKKGLNLEAMKEALSAETFDKLRKRIPAGIKANGIDPMEFVIQYGFSGVDEMVAQITAVKTKKVALAQRIGQLQAGYRATLKAENTRLYRDIVKEELSILEEVTGMKAGEVEEVDVEAFDDEQLIADIRQDNTLVKAALAEGKSEEALKLKAKQKEKISRIYEKKAEQKKRASLDRRMSKHWKSKSISEEYRDQVAKFLGEFYSIPDAYVADPTEGLVDFLKRKADGGEAAAASALIPSLFEVPVQRRDSLGRRVPLSMQEKELVADIADQLVHMGRQEKILLRGKDKIEFELDLQRKIGQAYETFGIEPEEFSLDPLVREPKSAVKSVTDTLSLSAQRFNALLRRMEFDLELLDGGIDGPNAEIFRSITSAEAQELLLAERFNKRFADIMAAYDAKWAKQQYSIPGTDTKLTKEQLFMIALNSASSGNRLALMGANDPSLSPAQRQNLINKDMSGNRLTELQISNIVNEILTDQERESVNQIWDMFEELYPMLNEIHKALNGVPLKRVDGKYFPMVIDRVLATQSAEFIELEKTSDPFMNEYVKRTVEARSRIERTGGKQPLQLTLSVITQSLSDSIHDITHQIPVRNALRILEDGRYARMVEDTLGKPRYLQMKEWVTHVARPRQPIISDYDKFFQFLRRNATVAHLGFKVTVAMKQVLSYTQVIDELDKLGYSGTSEAVKGLTKFYGDVEGGLAFANESSVFMRNRTRNWDRDAGEILAADAANPFAGPMKKQMFQAFMALTSLGDRAAVYPAWTAGYTVGMQKHENDHNKAVEFADRLVRVTQPANSPKDLSPSQRGGELSRLITMFQGFFNMYYQRIGDTFTQHRLGKIDTFQLMKSIWWTTILPAAIPGLVAGGFSAATGEPPEPEEFLIDMGKDLISFPTASVPILRDIVGQAVTGRPFTLTPVESALDTAAFGVELIRDGIDRDEEVNLDSARKTGINLLGYLFGIPSAQINVTADGIVKLMSGEPLTLQSATGIVIRQPKKTKKKKIF